MAYSALRTGCAQILNQGIKTMSRQKKTNDLIDQLVQERKARRLTQEELAKIMCCPQPSISRVERRVTSPTLEYIQKMCNCLGVELYIRPCKK